MASTCIPYMAICTNSPLAPLTPRTSSDPLQFDDRPLDEIHAERQQQQQQQQEDEAEEAEEAESEEEEEEEHFVQGQQSIDNLRTQYPVRTQSPTTCAPNTRCGTTRSSV